MAVITQVNPASGRYFRTRFLWAAAVFLIAAIVLALQPHRAAAAPYAAMVIDSRTGEVLHSRNADTRLHPASLTKMMTLYIAFEAVRNGEISLDTKVKISRNAAAEPPSKLGLRSGQRIAFRYLIRAAAVKSANDAATAIGETLSGSEAAFARRMNRTARALGMSRTTFKNAHGLTASGHLSTARDMTTLGRHLLYDYPEYYNLFSRRTTNAGVREVPNTNRRLLASYRGADGIKTGYTRAAGSNLVASAKRGNERIIATVFGGTSSTARNAKVAELLDLGFRRAPTRAALRKPQRPAYQGTGVVIADAGGSSSEGAAGKTIRVSGQVNTSLRPRTRPGLSESPVLVAALEEALQTPPAKDASPAEAADQTGKIENVQTVSAAGALQGEAIRNSIAVALAEAEAEPAPAARPATATVIAAVQQAPFTGLRPAARPASLADAAASPEPEPVVVTRLSTSGGRYWGVNVGLYTNRYQAEKVLLRTAMSELETLDGSLRKVAKTRRGFEANFLGMSQDQAELACRRLNARNVTCKPIGPS
ncbi:D-alanyl-D-alanine carboxypeptidase family protein [Leisingera sp.]|uniref:D-alanyl-D-alanine carboxypeptidase family protein n=1 Tax=Leisingera sp. TaxID=1879318 RepID=UPI002B278BFF|nr:D-alanyl-D-alanine carboxypeptidase family protein [Leisingera sp.]